MLQANYKTLLSLRLSQDEFAIIKELMKLSEKRARIGCQINFLKRCRKYNIIPSTIRNIHLPTCFQLPKFERTMHYLHAFLIKKMIQHLHLTLHKHINAYNEALTTLPTTIKIPIPQIINQIYHYSVDHEKKRLKQKFQWTQNKQQHHNIHRNHAGETNDFKDEPHNTILQNQPRVTDLSHSLTNEEKELLSLGPKFILTQKINDKLLLDLETNFCRTAYQLKWLTFIDNTPNPTSPTNKNSQLPTYTLDNPLHPPPANQVLDSKLSRLKQAIFQILKGNKKK